MKIADFFRRLRGKITGLNAISARFDILQMQMDHLFAAVKNLESVPETHLVSNALEQPSEMEEADTNRDVCPIGVVIPEDSIRLVADSISDIYEVLHPTKKFAFLIHEPSMMVHYADVWKALDPSKFAIITTEWFGRDVNGNEKIGAVDFFNYASMRGYEVRKINEIINCGIKFEYVVTNHVISGSAKESKLETDGDNLKKLINRGLVFKGKYPLWEFPVDIETYLPLQVGNKQIRYMYGADISDGWSLQNWNEIYDVFLCHGVNDQREIKKRFKGTTFVMGYPRYDRFFSENIDLSDIRSEFGISGSKKTVLWMPTLGGDYSSIPLFAEPFSKLNEKYNIIVRPHPISFVQETDFITLLEKFNFVIDRNAVRDMNELFGVANVVLVDNGGTPFSAIFLGKNVVFLDVPDDLGSESPATAYIARSSVTELKKIFPVIKCSETDVLERMLDSEDFYSDNSKTVGIAFQRYFGTPRGGGAKRVANFLNLL